MVFFRRVISVSLCFLYSKLRGFKFVLSFQIDPDIKKDLSAYYTFNCRLGSKSDQFCGRKGIRFVSYKR